MITYLQLDNRRLLHYFFKQLFIEYIYLLLIINRTKRKLIIYLQCFHKYIRNLV